MELWQVLLQVAMIYPMTGFYLGVMWYWVNPQEENRSLFEKVTMPLVMMFMWPLDLQPMDKAHLNRKKKTATSKKLRQERKRMALEIAREEAAVELLEASADHRVKMNELAARRRRVEARP